MPKGKTFRVDWCNKKDEVFGQVFDNYFEAKSFMIALVARNYSAFENHEKAFNIRIYQELAA